MEAKKLVGEIFIIVLLSCVFGGIVNISLVRRFLAGEFRQSFLDQTKYGSIRFITLVEAQDLFLAHEAVFIDSRSREEFGSGRIPGALNIPLEENKDGLRAALPFPADRILVVYCEGGDCQTSISLAKLIQGRGFRDIRIFMGGFGEWTEAGLPAETGHGPQ